MKIIILLVLLFVSAFPPLSNAGGTEDILQMFNEKILDSMPDDDVGKSFFKGLSEDQKRYSEEAEINAARQRDERAIERARQQKNQMEEARHLQEQLSAPQPANRRFIIP